MQAKPTTTSILTATGLILLCVIGALAVWRMDSAADRGSGLPTSFSLDVADQWSAGQDQLGYVETAVWQLSVQEVRGIAVGLEDRVFVAGDQSVHVFEPDGRPVATIALEGPPSSVAVGAESHAHPGRVYVSIGDRIEGWDLDGNRTAVWSVPGDDPIVTSIAAAEQDLFVADAASRRVWRLDMTGKLVTTIGESLDSQTPGFIVPSPFFDVAMSPEGFVHVANPGARRLESYTLDGDLESIWGNTTSQIAGFFGCCNPVHIAIFSDGRFATSEKGIPRIKTYREDGDFECLVAGPPQLGLDAADLGDPRNTQTPRVYDIAVDRRHRVLVLDPVGRRVVVYQADTQRENSAQEETDD